MSHMVNYGWEVYIYNEYLFVEDNVIFVGRRNMVDMDIFHIVKLMDSNMEVREIHYNESL